MNLLDRIGSIGSRILGGGAAVERRSSPLAEGLAAAAASGTLAGVTVTPATALNFAATFAAINCLSTDLACLPVEVYKARKGGGRDVATGHEARELLAVSPDGVRPAMRYKQASFGHVFGHGNGLSEIEVDTNQRPLKLHILSPSGTKPVQRADGLFYKLENGNELPASRVVHLAGWGYDGLVGYSPVRQLRSAIGLGMAAELFGGSLFGNGSMPRGILKTAQKLNKEAKAQLREQWESIHRGPHRGNRVAVLENGLEWQATQLDPEEAQFLATRAFQILEIARAFRVPPNKLMDYSQAHLANVEQMNLDYLCTSLMPWIESFEQEWTLKLLTRQERDAGYYIEANMAAFLRADMAARAQFYTSMRDLGVLTPNMICELENLNPIGPAGDIRLVPLNMTRLENAGQVVEKQGAKRGQLAKLGRRVARLQRELSQLGKAA